MADHAYSHRPSHAFFENEAPQKQSPLFQLPGELRDQIFTLALGACEDKTRLYDTNTYWSRPGYSAPRRSDLALLRTCKAIYHEIWFKPFSCADHSFWLGSDTRRPLDAVSFDSFAIALKKVQAQQGDVEIDHIRFFAQMFALERTDELQQYLDLPHFLPKVITITIRHTDWWFWEADRWLSISAEIARNNRFPSSIRTITFELESLGRKKDQVDSLVKQMKESWHLTKMNGSLLSARKTTVGIERWKGSSTWNGQRWVRDEDESKPGMIDYYVASVSFEYEPGPVAAGMPLPCDLVTEATPTVLTGAWATLDQLLLDRAEYL